MSSDFKKYAIYTEKSKLSIESVKRTILSAKEIGGLEVEAWKGHDRYECKDLRKKYPFKILDKKEIWDRFCYFESTIACFFSHFSLWKKCVETKEKIMIMEHDTIFTDRYVDFDFEGVITIGKPLWGVGPNNDIRELVDQKGDVELLKWDCSCTELPFLEHSPYDCSNFKCNSWCLKGAHAYIITPITAEKLIAKSYDLGIVPADNHINRYNIEIAETQPSFAYQDARFSLVTRHISMMEDKGLNINYQEDWVEGEEAWEHENR